MLIEATPRDAAALAALLPDDGANSNELPVARSVRVTGRVVPSPEGTTVRYRGMQEFRGADIAPVLQFILDVGATVTGTVIAAWLVGKFRGRASRVTINRREIDLDDEGQVRRIVEEEVKIRPE